MNTITIDPSLYRGVELYARSHDLSVRDIVEKYLKQMLAKVTKKNAAKQNMYSWDELCGIFESDKVDQELVDDYLLEKYGV